MTHHARPALRKAAILISSLDSASADKLLDQMDSEQAARIRSAILQLETIGDDEQEQVIREFLGVGHLVPKQAGGIELDESLARQLQSAKKQAPGQTAPAAGSQVADKEAPPFRFLHEAATDTLIQFLQREHPQTVAVVVSHLPPAQAADVITSLAPALQAQVIKRVALLEETDPDIIREIEQTIQTLFHAQVQTFSKRSSGFKAVQAILATTDSIDRRDIMRNLTTYDPDLARHFDAPEQVTLSLPAEPTVAKSPPESSASGPQRTGSQATETWPAKPPHARSDRPLSAATDSARHPAAATRNAATFDDLQKLTDRDWAQLMQAAGAELTLLALTGADGRLVDRLLNSLPPGESQVLRRRMERLGPLRLQDIEAAQQQMVEIARQLTEQGVIRTTPKRQAFAAAA